MRQITTFLMFAREQHGKAKEAIHFYISLFENSGIEHIEYYGPKDTQPEGTVKWAAFTLGGERFMAIDSAAPHAFSFTPSISLFVDCDSEGELKRLYEALSNGGKALMPLDNYGFSKQFGWVNDRFGVSWQLNLPAG